MMKCPPGCPFNFIIYPLSILSMSLWQTVVCLGHLDIVSKYDFDHIQDRNYSLSVSLQRKKYTCIHAVRGWLTTQANFTAQSWRTT